jgi:hypothetical protein
MLYCVTGLNRNTRKEQTQGLIFQILILLTEHNYAMHSPTNFPHSNTHAYTQKFHETPTQHRISHHYPNFYPQCLSSVSLFYLHQCLSSLSSLLSVSITWCLSTLPSASIFSPQCLSLSCLSDLAPMSFLSLSLSLFL